MTRTKVDFILAVLLIVLLVFFYGAVIWLRVDYGEIIYHDLGDVISVMPRMFLTGMSAVLYFWPLSITSVIILFGIWLYSKKKGKMAFKSIAFFVMLPFLVLYPFILNDNYQEVRNMLSDVELVWDYRMNTEIYEVKLGTEIYGLPCISEPVTTMSQATCKINSNSSLTMVYSALPFTDYIYAPEDVVYEVYNNTLSETVVVTKGNDDGCVYSVTPYKHPDGGYMLIETEECEVDQKQALENWKKYQFPILTNLGL
ncbi:MAG: hypothetical protein Q8P90_00330 [bacterium]|nr:hypothetical protein [bacterium]